MSGEPDFQEMFKQNMDQLNSIQDDIRVKITEKSEFSKQILPQLQDINRKLAIVRDKFNLLQKQLKDLETEIKSKDEGIADAGTACAGLQNEIERLTQESAALQAEIQRLQGELTTSQNQQTGLSNQKQEMDQLINQLKTKEEELNRNIAFLQERLKNQEGDMEKN